MNGPCRGVVMVLAALVASIAGVRVAEPTHQPSNAKLTISDSPDPAGAGGNVLYTVAGLNDGPVRSCPLPPENCSDVPTLQANIPASATFVSCTTATTSDGNSPLPGCAVSGNTVTAVFKTVQAHKTVTMRLTVKAPNVSSDTEMTLSASFSGESMHMDQKSVPTLVLPLTTTLQMLPSDRRVTIGCGDVVDAAAFGSDTEARMLSSLICGGGSGITLTASGKIFGLAGKKIYSSQRIAGTAGIIVGPNAVNLTIRGGGTGGTRGIEQFDYCIKDLGGNTGLLIDGLRCFRARSAGILTLSNGALIQSSLVDNTNPGPNDPMESPPGGIGIEAGGDNTRVKDTIVRRSAMIGFWAYGNDTDGSGLVATFDGNTASSRIERSFAIGALLSNGPHKIKGTTVQADDGEPLSREGVVVASDARGTVIQEVVIKQHRGHGIVVESGATGTLIERTTVEEIGGNGFVIDGPSTLNGNSAQLVLGDCFVVNASATLTSNSVESCSGNAFLINAAAIVDSNSAVDNAGHGFVVAHSSSGGGAGTGSTFADVPVNHIFLEFIEALFAAGITGGCGTDPVRYCPDAPVTREQMAVFLVRAINGAGATPPPATGTVYADVPVDHPLTAWIEQLASLGITGGCATNPLRYCPGGTVTRGQMAVFLLRTKYGAGYQAPEATGMFTDVPPAHIFARWIEQFAREGTTGGCGTNPARYCPENPVTRGQMAVLLARTISLPVSGGVRLRSNTAEANAAGGFLVSGSGTLLSGNNAKNNGGAGFDITGSANALDTNTAERSAGPEFAIGPSNTDDRGNRANGSVFTFTPAGGTFE